MARAEVPLFATDTDSTPQPFPLPPFSTENGWFNGYEHWTRGGNRGILGHTKALQEVVVLVVFGGGSGEAGEWGHCELNKKVWCASMQVCCVVVVSPVSLTRSLHMDI